MKRYTPDTETILYRLYVCRQRFDRLRRAGLTGEANKHGDAAVKSYEHTLAGLGLTGDVLEAALCDRWLEHEGNEMRMDRFDKCLTMIAQVQARIKAGAMTVEHPKAFTCELHIDCLDCDCYSEATDDTVEMFKSGIDVFTGEPIPGFNI